MDRLLYAERAAEALRAAEHLGKNQQALAKAVVAVIKKKAKAAKGARRRPGRAAQGPALHLRAHPGPAPRRQDHGGRRALLAAAPRDPQVIVNPDAWWVERRLVSRALIERRRRQARLHARRRPLGRDRRRCAPRPSSTPAGTRSSTSTIPATAARHFAAIADDLDHAAQPVARRILARPRRRRRRRPASSPLRTSSAPPPIRRPSTASSPSPASAASSLAISQPPPADAGRRRSASPTASWSRRSGT